MDYLVPVRRQAEAYHTSWKLFVVTFGDQSTARYSGLVKTMEMHEIPAPTADSFGLILAMILR